MKNTKILCCFPGTGKSFAKKHEDEIGLKILDADSSQFHWIYSNGTKTPNPNFLSDYMQYISTAYKSKEYDIIFMSTHTDVLNELRNIGLPFSVFIPTIDCKDTYLSNYKARGNDSAFIERISDNWEKWLEGLKEQKCMNVVSLKKGTYLSAYLLNFDYIQRRTLLILKEQSEWG